jgi:tetratricopeptide (TPR) repeat protein
LSETARQLLGAAAVIGRSFDFGILDAVSGRSEQETVEGLEELTSHGLLVEMAQAGMPQYDFTHEKLRAMVYQDTSLARRRLLHRRAAEAFLARTRAGGDAGTPSIAGQIAGQVAGQVAHHFRAGGEDARAAEFYKRAGDYARLVFANRDAVENYAAALALGFPDAAALHTGIGDAQTLLGEYDAALASYEAGAAFGAPDAEARIARVYLRRGEWERAAHHLENALAAARDDAALPQLHADLAFALHRLGHDDQALKHAARALRLAQKVKAQEARMLAQAQSHNMLGILARTRGEWAQALEHLEASRALAEQRNDAGAHAAALNNLALVHRARDEDGRALELAQRALELVTREGDRHRQAAMHNHLADLYHALGRPAESMEQLKRAVAIYAEIGGPAGAWQPEIWKLQEW